MDIYTVRTSVETQAQADTLLKSVLTARLAACVHMAPISSAYWWQDEITKADEVGLVFKTTADRVEVLMKHIQTDHPYEISEIIAHKCDKIDPDYANWVEKETR